MTTLQDFTPTGLKLEGAWENDRNAESRDLLKAIVREVYGAEDVIVAHHIAYVAKEERTENDEHGIPRTYHYETVEEIPSSDTLIFDHDAARKLWGSAWQTILTKLALEPVETRNALLGKFWAARNQLLKDGALPDHPLAAAAPQLDITQV